MPGVQAVTWTGAETPAEALLAGRENAVVALWGQEPSGNWAFYMPALPQFINTLKTLHRGESVLVLANEATQLVP